MIKAVEHTVKWRELRAQRPLRLQRLQKSSQRILPVVGQFESFSENKVSLYWDRGRPARIKQRVHSRYDQT